MELVISPLTACMWEQAPSGQNHTCQLLPPALCVCVRSAVIDKEARSIHIFHLGVTDWTTEKTT